jgi:NAD(P)-dependent dehydrogenase (short-subunit alcohol dehydrogenase family)
VNGPTPSAGPVTLITGAGSGIGAVLAVMLAEGGHRLALVGRRRAALEQTAGACVAVRGEPGTRPAPLVLVADVADAHAVQAAVTAAAGHFGGLTNLVNNAATAPAMGVEETTPARFETVLRTNTLGPAAATAAAWGWMVRGGGGCVVNVSSLASVDPLPGFFAYGASKAALNAMALSCTREGAAVGIRAFSVAPGAVETPMLRGLFDEHAVPRGACLSPEQVAEEIAACLGGERDAWNGRTILVRPGLSPGASPRVEPL